MLSKIYIPIHRILAIALSLTPCASALVTTTTRQFQPALDNMKRQSPGTLSDILGLPISTLNIRETNLTLATFNDEVIDISNISLFGTVNDGSFNCTPEAIVRARAVDRSVTSPATATVNIGSLTITLLTFGDEVIDISGISIFGDVNDNGCE
ncbi:uncharacterized protein L3040_007269 [Drepanopeziza brunnea f. sp. 'multigermtubi']|uniref:Uncharacterized protein n=1 Tax=Marssonina brunnea f. sp. multigermtubi (strain MB_m1) TaxID=1072389 RepID=K1XE97_MARBU|nr:uncharacterized protein MBM_02395 [Drepanopeziza brunnea f. sp. 'multigermtubi' MB_m1]EKD19158.1 hypothetical protein MBM_02395 [Drepanopeziza brunnea f. sp. 'multigermtubi' MB_m1]KAJ5038406.1 hypothetical protein L3040_007269 [Drepanopeziza brunnea f. sp. 'multigermtubi']